MQIPVVSIPVVSIGLAYLKVEVFTYGVMASEVFSLGKTVTPSKYVVYSLITTVKFGRKHHYSRGEYVSHGTS